MTGSPAILAGPAALGRQRGAGAIFSLCLAVLRARRRFQDLVGGLVKKTL
jgi:hypothetical protein